LLRAGGFLYALEQEVGKGPRSTSGILMTNDLQILNYFDPALFVPHLAAQTKDGVLSELVEAVARAKGVRDSSLLLEMLQRRESLGSTGIGKGVAIPHGRSLAMESLKVVFARSAKGVEFDAVDAKPVKLFFLIVAPPQDKKNEYLPLLGKIAGLVKVKKVRDRLLKVEDFDRLKAVLEESEELE
jgi:PTS system nitrogen regulatory IIA component